jgi:hypothetical protein
MTARNDTRRCDACSEGAAYRVTVIDAAGEPHGADLCKAHTKASHASKDDPHGAVQAFDAATPVAERNKDFQKIKAKMCEPDRQRWIGRGLRPGGDDDIGQGLGLEPPGRPPPKRDGPSIGH